MAMRDRDGFQPCAIDTDTAPPMPRWERNLVVTALVTHVVDITLDVLVVLVFLSSGHTGFALCSSCVIIWMGLVSSLYVSFGGGQHAVQGDGIDSPRGVSLVSRAVAFVLNFAQVQIFTEAYRCIFQHGDTDYFHTLRLMEAILESAPNSVVQLYALVSWAGAGDAISEAAVSLLKFSVFTSFVSVGLGLAMWEQKVQFRTSGGYIAAVALMRAFEIASRSLTLALFAGLTQNYGGIWAAILVDYGVMVMLILKHQSVQFTYGLFVAVPLVFVSLEPLVWRREDHAVPKDYYYTVRVLEFVVMWTVIIYYQFMLGDSTPGGDFWADCQVWALFSTLALYLALLMVWRVARKHELSRDVADWGEDSRRDVDPLTNEGLFSDSEGSASESGSEAANEGLLDAEAAVEGAE